MFCLCVISSLPLPSELEKCNSAVFSCLGSSLLQVPLPFRARKTLLNSCVFLRLFSPLSHSSPTQTLCFLYFTFVFSPPPFPHLPLFQRYGQFGCVFVFGFFSTPAIVSMENTAISAVFCVFYLCILSSPISHLTQTRKMRPNCPRFSCLCSSLLPLKNHGCFFCVLAEYISTTLTSDIILHPFNILCA